MQNFQAWSKHKMATGKHLQIKEICLGARVLAAGHGRFAVWLDLAHDVEEAGLTSCKHDMTFICTVFPAHFALRFSSRPVEGATAHPQWQVWARCCGMVPQGSSAAVSVRSRKWACCGPVSPQVKLLPGRPQAHIVSLPFFVWVNCGKPVPDHK